MTKNFQSALFLSTLAASLIAAGCSSSAPPAKQAEATKATTPAKPVVYFKVDPATAGTVTGRIVFTGKAPARKKIDMDEDPLCAKQHKSAVYDDAVEVGRNGAARECLRIHQGAGSKARSSSRPPIPR